MILPIVIRDFREADRSFVEGGWKRIILSQPHYRWLRHIRAQAVGYIWLNKLIPLIIASSQIAIAANPEDDDHILGWACGDSSGIIHCVFVRPRYRNLGIARQLMDSIGLSNDATVSLWHRCMLKKKCKYRYNPLIYMDFLEKIERE